MTADEQEIINYLQTCGAEFVGAAEICRRATIKKRYHKEPDWAKPILLSMKDRGILEADNQGRYRLKIASKRHAIKQWIAPDIEKILRDNDLEVDRAAREADSENPEHL